MKRAVIIANSYFMLITAIQIRRTLLKEYDVDMILGDHSNGSEAVARNIDSTGVFHRVKYVHTHKLSYEPNKKKRILNDLKIRFSNLDKLKEYIFDDGDMDYDYIVYCNVEYVLYYYLRYIQDTYHRTPKFIRYEEGISSYGSLIIFPEAKSFTVIKKLFQLTKRRDVWEVTDKLMCYLPDLIPENDHVKGIKIPAISSEDESLKKILNITFAYDPSADSFDKKYIYFATSSDIDGNGVGETELVLQLAELVGKDNLIVKMHPRDKRNVYADNGLQVWGDTSTPWEVIRINHSFENRIFITLNSGSLINSSVFFNDTVPCYYLSPMVHGKSKEYDVQIKRVNDFLDTMQKRGYCQNIHLIDDMKQIVDNEQ